MATSSIYADFSISDNKKADAFATDLSDIVDVLKYKAHIDGIMGSDILNQYSAVIDYGKCVIRFVNET